MSPDMVAGDIGKENFPNSAVTNSSLNNEDAEQTLNRGCSANKSDLDKADALPVRLHDQDAASPSNQSQCDIVSSDYRFVYLGCKVSKPYISLHFNVPCPC